MKKTISFVLILAMLLSMCVTTVFASDTATLSSTMAEGNKLNKGDSFDVTVTIPPVSGFANVTVKIAFKKDVLKVTSLELPTSIEGYATTTSEVANANTQGAYVVTYAGSSNISMTTALVMKASFEVLTSATEGVKTDLIKIDTCEFSDDNDSAVTAPSFDKTSISATILKAPIASVTASVNQPVKGTPLATTVTVDSSAAYTGTVNWYEGDTADGTEASSNAKPNQVYTAKITLTAKEGESFANSLNNTTTTDGYQINFVNEGKLELTKTFGATEDKALTSISITGDATADVPTKNNTATVNLTATATYDDGSTTSVTDSATWSVDPAREGVSVSRGTVTIQPSAADGEVTIKAVYGGQNKTHKITLSKTAPALTVLTISGDSSVSVPSTSDSPKETSYSVSGENQYGAPFTPTSVSWSIDGTTPTGVSIDASTGKLSVTNEASDGDVTIKAASDTGVSDTKPVTITKAAAVPTTVTISGGVDSLNVPALATFPGTTSADATAFTAVVMDQYGAVMPGQTVTWTVTGNAGVSIDTDGKLTITNSATDADVTVTATCGSVTGTKTVTVTKDTPAAKFVQVKKAGTVVENDTITIPTSGSSSNTVTYTAEVYDQYGTKMDSESVNWSIPATTGVSVSDGTVTVESTASAGTVTLTAASSSVPAVKATVTITLTNKTAHVISSFAEAAMTITYGDAIIGQTVTCTTGGTVEYSSSYPAAVSVDENTGALTILAARTSPVTITATVAEDAAHAAASKSYTVTVNKKELTITGLTAENRNYEAGNTNVALTGGTLTGVVGSDVVSVTLPTTGTISDASVGDNKAVTVVKPELTGSNKDNYTLADITGITVNIRKADPDVGTVSCSGGTIYTSTALDSITLTKTGSAAGTLKLTDGQTLTAGTNDYGWTFTPSDTTNYNTLTGTVSLTVTEDTLSGIGIGATTPTKTSYKYGETFDPTGLTVTATYASGASRTLSSSEYTVANGTMAVGQTEVTLTYQGKTCTVSGLTVSKADAPSLANIAVNQKYSVTAEQSKQIGSIMPDDAGTLTYVAGTPSVTSGTATVNSFTVDASGLVKYTITGGENGAVITLPVTIGSDNYADSIVNVVITLTDKETPTASANDITVTYNGADVPASAITGTASVAGTWSWKATPPKTVADSGSHVVVFTPADTVNFAAVEDTITVTITKATPTGTPSYTAITASGKTLSDANLAIGTITPASGTIKWVNADNSELANTTVVAANASYKWLYTPADTANYTTLTGSITPYVVSYGGGGSVTTYSVTVGKTENGTVSVSPKSAAKGSTVTITVAPDKGYTLETLTVLDKDGKELKLTEKDGKYTFTMPAGKVEVKATFMDDNTMLNYFVDVKAGDYFYDAVLWAAQKGITNGVNAVEFGPNLSCTRAQIVTFLWRAAGSPEPKGTGSFADVPADSYYAKAVAWAVENGITGGTGNGQFDPDATCTREQAVTFLYRASGSPAVSGGSTFSDVAENAYYADAVVWAEKNGITGGIGGGQFGSGNDCTRGQIVTLLYRAYSE